MALARVAPVVPAAGKALAAGPVAGVAKAVREFPAGEVAPALPGKNLPLVRVLRVVRPRAGQGVARPVDVRGLQGRRVSAAHLPEVLQPDEERRGEEGGAVLKGEPLAADPPARGDAVRREAEPRAVPPALRAVTPVAAGGHPQAGPGGFQTERERRPEPEKQG